MDTKRLPILYAILAAVCYGISAPIAKLILSDLPPIMTAAMLYLGAGLGMLAVNTFRGKRARKIEARITRKELPFTLAMIALDIAAPVLLMLGLTRSAPATVSLLGNFEIAVTTVLARAIFKEAVGRRMWLAIALITLASAILSFDGTSKLTFSPGSVLVLLACICWGIENNCTSKLAHKDPLQTVVVKGLCSGGISLLIALASGERIVDFSFLSALLLGFAAYGLSIYLYILAQRSLGAARTSAYYAFAPFIGVALSLAMFREAPTLSFVAALAVMLAGAYLAAFERHSHAHTHVAELHEHRHSHDDGHHTHSHDKHSTGDHSHAHTHSGETHSHPHTPDLHHHHTHE